MISPFWIFVDTAQRRMRERKEASSVWRHMYNMTRVLNVAIADGRTTITIEPFEEDFARDLQIESVSYATEPEDAERAAQTLWLGKIKIPARVAADLNAREDAIDRRLYKQPRARKFERKHEPRLSVKARGSDRFEDRVEIAWFEKAARAAVKESEKK